MASVSSLDKDLRNLRMSKYSPQAANEVRDWLEEVLGEKLPAGDLLDALKDGVVLCKLAAVAVPPGPKFKASKMPFVQMENISHFLKACQAPPLGMHAHDVFLTVDLFEKKDPAQVIQCLSAFSRRVNEIQPDRFPRTIGPKSRGQSVSGTNSPQRWGSQSTDGTIGRDRAASNTSQGSSSAYNASSRLGYNPSEGDTPGSSPSTRSNGGSATKVKGSWSKTDSAAAPAWNIHQYGYMGGASQGNQGINFGGRRQITTPAPKIPSLAEKEKKRKEELAEQERRQREMEEAEQRERAEREAEEEREKVLEQQRWAEETRKLREEERAAEAEARKLEAMNRQIEEDEERLQRERREADAKRAAERTQANPDSDARLQGQFLSDYQAEERKRSLALSSAERLQHDLQDRGQDKKSRSPVRGHDHAHTPSHQLQENSWEAKERDYIRQEWSHHHTEPFGSTSPRASDRHDRPQVISYSPQHSPTRSSHLRQAYMPSSPTRQRPRDSLDSDSHYEGSIASPPRQDVGASSRALPDPTPVQVKTNTTGPSSRPLPDPNSYASTPNRTDQFLSSNPAPVAEKPRTYLPNEFSFDSSAERDMEDARRHDSQARTQAGGWASKSLLEREMEKERQRQQEWEQGQQATQDAVHRGVGQGQHDNTAGPGGTWDVNQYGWTGGDSQNRGGPGLGGRRQIIGPRPPP